MSGSSHSSIIVNSMAFKVSSLARVFAAAVIKLAFVRKTGRGTAIPRPAMSAKMCVSSTMGQT